MIAVVRLQFVHPTGHSIPNHQQKETLPTSGKETHPILDWNPLQKDRLIPNIHVEATQIFGVGLVQGIVHHRDGGQERGQIGVSDEFHSIGRENPHRFQIVQRMRIGVQETFCKDQGKQQRDHRRRSGLVARTHPRRCRAGRNLITYDNNIHT